MGPMGRGEWQFRARPESDGEGLNLWVKCVCRRWMEPDEGDRKG